MRVDNTLTFRTAEPPGAVLLLVWQVYSARVPAAPGAVVAVASPGTKRVRPCSCIFISALRAAPLSHLYTSRVVDL